MKELEHMDLERVREEKGRGTDRRAWWTSSRSPWRRCQWRSPGGVELRRFGGASRRWQCHPLDRIRVRTVGCGGGEPRTVCRLSHLLFIGTVRRGPTSHEMAGRPRSGRGQGVRLDRWVEPDEINSNSVGSAGLCFLAAMWLLLHTHEPALS